jgi:hypothetical protein
MAIALHYLLHLQVRYHRKIPGARHGPRYEPDQCNPTPANHFVYCSLPTLPINTLVCSIRKDRQIMLNPPSFAGLSIKELQ